MLPIRLAWQGKRAVGRLLVYEVQVRAAPAAFAAPKSFGNVANPIREALALEVPPHRRRREYALPAAAPAGELDRVVMRRGIEEIAHRIDEVAHGSIPNFKTNRLRSVLYLFQLASRVPREADRQLREERG